MLLSEGPQAAQEPQGKVGTQPPASSLDEWRVTCSNSGLSPHFGLLGPNLGEALWLTPSVGNHSLTEASPLSSALFHQGVGVGCRAGLQGRMASQKR